MQEAFCNLRNEAYDLLRMEYCLRLNPEQVRFLTLELVDRSDIGRPSVDLYLVVT